MTRTAATAATLALAAGALVLGSCSMEPRLALPPPPVPQTWPVGDAYLAASEATLPDYTWREVFGDPRLQAVIGQALANNQDIALSLANVAAARAQYGIQKAELLPQLDASASYRRADTGSGASDAIGVDLGVTAFEIDLFGRVRSLTGAARSSYLGSEAALRGARLTLVADVASAWIAYGADASLLKVAKDTAAAAEESYRLTKIRLDGGVAPRTDLRQAEIVLRTAQADVAEQTTALAQDLNALNLLVGASIDAANLPTSIGDAAAKLREVPAGLDSSVLLRRPDVIEAEWQLRAANARIGAARAALFPRISLTGLLGLASNALGSLFSGGAFTWQAGASVDYSIFSGGAGKQNVELTKAQRDAALASYRKAIQSAFADVANALARRGTIDAQTKAVSQGRAAAADNQQLADLRYRGGIDSYLQSLTARQALYSAERNLIAVQQLRAANLVAIYRALGGDSALGGTTPQTP